MEFCIARAVLRHSGMSISRECISCGELCRAVAVISSEVCKSLSPIQADRRSSRLVDFGPRPELNESSRMTRDSSCVLPLCLLSHRKPSSPGRGPRLHSGTAASHSTLPGRGLCGTATLLKRCSYKFLVSVSDRNEKLAGEMDASTTYPS